MSAHIATFKTMGAVGVSEQDLDLQAFVGNYPPNHVSGRASRCIQFSIGGKYTCLTEHQLRVLVTLVQKRIDGEITATGNDYDYVIGCSGLDESI